VGVRVHMQKWVQDSSHLNLCEHLSLHLITHTDTHMDTHTHTHLWPGPRNAPTKTDLTAVLASSLQEPQCVLTWLAGWRSPCENLKHCRSHNAYLLAYLAGWLKVPLWKSKSLQEPQCVLTWCKCALNWEAWLWCRLFKVSLQRDKSRLDELQMSQVPYREVACKGGAARTVHAIIKH